MTATAQHVAVNGFNAPPVPAAPVPQAPDAQPQQQFAPVPPAGPAAQLPGVSAAQNPNGQAYQLPGQRPGYNPAANQQAPAQPPAPGAQPDIAGLVTMLQATLAGQNPNQPAAAQQPAQGDVQRPGWVPSNINEFNPASIEDPIIRSMATVMQSAGKGLDLDRVLGKALSHGDPALIDVNYLREAGGQNAQQLHEIAKGIVDAVVAKSEAITKGIHDSVGGEANWHNATAAFNASAPHELKVTVAQMLDSTNENFIKAGAKIVSEFGRNSGYLPQQGAALLNSVPAGANAQGLSKAQFQTELRKVSVDAPGGLEARQALFTRRAQGKAAGL